MKRILALIILLVFISCKQEKSTKESLETDKIDIELKEKLENILLRDQGIREIVNGNLSDKRKVELLSKLKLNKTDIEVDKKFNLMREIDSLNLIEIENIIKNYGYPSKSLVGEPANKAVFYVIQHSNKIDKYLPLIRKAAKSGDITKTSLALMEDRNLMYNGREQIYGTQIKGKANKKGEWIYFLWPIKDIDSVDIWRKEAGFKQNLKEYLKKMDVEFKLYNISELNDL
ncbi:DUF6624 domain-containing protein [uncultured Psychroserpens sp.]|uniref:DUF6624 domain-containing protein n=1 Tax=uncultured Psychroserpens sp. TaxID=255436 RepID=UPI00263974F3|nr:DUF6624 domain-containing protein [uncultured Psychroserpens sp.]